DAQQLAVRTNFTSVEKNVKCSNSDHRNFLMVTFNGARVKPGTGFASMLRYLRSRMIQIIRMKRSNFLK
ncbi:MAG: hypothetical protein ACN6QT_00215, partial [Burkholderia contaminans]